METLGFIGIGIMGKPMAANLLRAHYPLSIVSRHPDREASLIAQGASVVGSMQELARTCNVMILMLPDTKAVEQTLFGDDGIIRGLRRGSVIVDMSTISPAKTMEFAQRLNGVGCAMLDAPVSGGEKGAESGTLGIMVGGSREVFERYLPIFEVMGKTITYTGPSGCGQKTKLVNQLVGATNLLGAVEGLRLARSAGLDPQTTLEAVSSGAASSWMLANLGPKILREDFAPGFSIRLQYKDMALLKEWTSEIGDDFPAADLVYSLCRKAMEAGLADQGNQGLTNLWVNREHRKGIKSSSNQS
jgi:3-hydroxyisobutyrate dehydrogenase